MNADGKAKSAQLERVLLRLRTGSGVVNPMAHMNGWLSLGGVRSGVSGEGDRIDKQVACVEQGWKQLRLGQYSFKSCDR